MEVNEEEDDEEEEKLRNDEEKTVVTQIANVVSVQWDDTAAVEPSNPQAFNTVEESRSIVEVSTTNAVVINHNEPSSVTPPTLE